MEQVIIVEAPSTDFLQRKINEELQHMHGVLIDIKYTSAAAKSAMGVYVLHTAMIIYKEA